MRAADIEPKHFLWSVADRVATITLNRPERKNPLTFDSYAELRDTFARIGEVEDVGAVVITGAGGNFCSGGDVHEIIGPLLDMNADDQLAFTRMTGDLVIAILSCPRPVIAAIDGVCVGAGAAIAMASDLRYGTERSRIAFLFVRVGLAGCDMGACAILPRIVGQGRAAELLYTGRAMNGRQASEWGFLNGLYEPDALLTQAHSVGTRMANGPTFAHAMTKKMLRREWDMPVIEAVRAEAEAQALCMQTKDFRRAYEAFLRKEEPKFEGD